MTSTSTPSGKAGKLLALRPFLLLLLLVGRLYAVEFSTLSNGLEYAIEKREGCGVVAIQVWVKVGSRQEQAELSGITHFIEHLIFKGTERLAANELASKIECMGGTINAFTSYDNTVYHMVIPKESFEEGLRILAESILNPAFPAEEVEKERRVILEEIKMGEDDPQRRLYKELFLLSFEGHPYGRPIIGFEETLYRIDRMHIMDYFRKHYTPHNMIVVIVGDVDEKKAKGLVEYSFKGMSGTPYEVALPVLPKGRGRQKVVPMDIKECYLALSYPIPPITHEDMPFLEIAASILGEGESSRLSEELKNRSGIVTEIGSFVFAQKDAGLFVIYATFNGKQQERVELAIEKVIRKILEGRLKRWEIEKAKNRLRASLTYAEETVQGRARQIGYFYSLTNRRDFVEWYMKRAEAATEKDIKRVIRKYLKGDVRNSVLLLPSTHNPKLIELENGLKVVMNRNGRGSFAFSLGFPGGLKDEGEGENGIFNLLARMLLRGTKRSTAQQIARRIDVLAGDITPFCGRNIFGLSGKFLSKDMEEVLSLLKELVAETLLNKEELERVKREVLSELRQKKDDPVSFTFRVFEEVFYDSHPYARDPSGSEDNVANARLEDLERCLRRFVAPRGAVLAISGDLDFDRAEAIVRRLFRSWKGSCSTLRTMAYEPKGTPKTFKVGKNLRQSHIIVGFKGVSLLQQERYAAEVLEAVLSRMGGRIYRALREERPYAYALTFFNRMAFDTGEMGVYVATDKDLTEEVLELIEKEIEGLEEGLEESEISDAKNFLIGTHLIRMQSNEAIAYRICLDTLYGLPPGSFKAWPRRIRDVKKEDLERLIKAHISKDKMVRVIVGNSQHDPFPIP